MPVKSLNNDILYYFCDEKPSQHNILGLSKRKFKITDLVITHEEKLRFEAACDLASNTKATTHSKSTRRIRINELHEVIWAAYCDLRERHNAPTSGQVWQKLVNNYKKYDTEEIIDEITKKEIVWTNFKGSRRTLKESSFKGTLRKIKKIKKINKTSK